MWYNIGVKIVVLGSAGNTPSRINLSWRSIVDSLSHHAENGNPQDYTVYLLTEPSEQFSWTDVRYVGLSVNVLYRYQQHLSCHGENAEKNEWIQGLLAQGKTPGLYQAEELQAATLLQGRQREQYWIRYAMSQGAELLNIAIVYTDEERLEASENRAIHNARVADLLARGIYVKRYGHGYPGRLLAPYEGDRKYTIVNARYHFIKLANGKQVSIEEATDEEFDTFIRQYVPVENYGLERWYTIERCQAINFALHHLAQEGA